MKIVVIGASGRIGEKLVYNLHQEDCTIFEALTTFADGLRRTGLQE